MSLRCCELGGVGELAAIQLLGPGPKGSGDVGPVDHIFLNCPFTRRLWVCGPLGIRITDYDSSFHQWFISLLLSVISLKNWDGLDSILSSTWAIWILRNNIRFRQAIWSPHVVFQIAQDCINRSLAARDLTSLDSSPPPGFGYQSCSFHLVGNSYIPPTVALVVDGAWNSHDCRAGVGWCFYSLDSDICLGGAARACFALSAIQAELLACLIGLRMALRRGFSQVLVRTDCQLSVSILRNSSSDISTIWIQHQVRHILSSFQVCVIQKVPRDGVRSAHLLATSARRRQFVSYFF
uniref:RNase H type-1 domain-containing protein n=1 Tax=Chenopodium quinoa TaxID=63459 RepID=A0A803MKK5_CHEQI